MLGYALMKKTEFEWDKAKDQENQKKHKVSFSLAQHAFLDPHRVSLKMLSIVQRKIDITVLAASVMA